VGGGGRRGKEGDAREVALAGQGEHTRLELQEELGLRKQATRNSQEAIHCPGQGRVVRRISVKRK